MSTWLARLAPPLLLTLLLGACSHVVDERSARPRDVRAEFDDDVRRAWTLYQENLHEAAERRYLAALEIARLLPPDDPSVLTARVALALVHQAQRRFERAEAELRGVLPIQRRVSGDASVPVANVLNNLGVVLVEQQRHAEGADALLAALRIREKLLGPDDPQTAITLQNFATAIRALGSHEDALLIYQRAYAIYQAHGPEWNGRAAAVQNQLGLLYREMGQGEEAELHHLAAIELTRRVNAARNPNLALYSRDLAGLYAELGRYGDAEQRYRTALSIFEATLGAASPQMRETLLDYGAMLERTGRRQEALELRARADRIAAEER